MRKPIIEVGNRTCMTTELFEQLCKTICEGAQENAELRKELKHTRDLLEFAECEADHYKESAKRMEKYENFYYAVKYGIEELDYEDENENVYVSNGIVWDGIHDNEDY
jgi:hypothetical protein